MDCRIWKFAVAIVAAAYFLSGPPRLSASETPAPNESMSIGGATINVEIEPGDLTVSRTQVLEWIRRSACAVTEYYAGFPVRKVDVKIVPIDEGKECSPADSPARSNSRNKSRLVEVRYRIKPGRRLGNEP